MPTKPKTKTFDQTTDPKQYALDFYHHVVFYEWDGHPPRMTYYDKLHRYGVYINKRGKRPKKGKAFAPTPSDVEYPNAPLARRHSYNFAAKAICVQEGVFLCANSDVATHLANLTQEYGARIVWIGTFHGSELHMSEQDANTAKAMQSKDEKKGRRPKLDKGIYTITCRKECITFEEELEYVPADCPHCGWYDFSIRPGGQRIYAFGMDENETAYDYWKRTRFDRDGNNFEIPVFNYARAGKKEKLAPGAPLLIPAVPPLPPLEIPQNMIDEMEANVEFALHVYDLAWCVMHTTTEKRREFRMEVINGYIRAQGTGVLFMGVPNHKIDLVDLCGLDYNLTVYLP